METLEKRQVEVSLLQQIVRDDLADDDKARKLATEVLSDNLVFSDTGEHPPLSSVVEHLVMLVKLAKQEFNYLATMPEYDQDDAHRLRHLASKVCAVFDTASTTNISQTKE